MNGEVNMNNYQAAIIGSLTINPKLFNVCVINEEHFDGVMRRFFIELKQLFAKDGDINLQKLFSKKNFDIDLFNMCTDQVLCTTVDSFNSLQQHAIDMYKTKCISEITEKLNSGEYDIESFDYAYRNIIENNITEHQYLTTKDLLNSCTNSIREIKFTRFYNLTRKLKLSETDFFVIAGGTGSGKTGLALNFLDDLSNNYRCLYFNMEMPKDRLNQRLIAINSSVQVDDIRDYKNLKEETINKIHNSINAIAQKNIEVINKSQSLEQIRNVVASQNHDKHLIVFIDHIGLIRYQKARSSYERITEIAKELRRMCLDFNCTVIGLSQLNRSKSEDRKPDLSMLRDSGELEQSARKVMFVWREEQEQANGTKKEMYSLVIEKNDAGNKGIVDVDYYKQTQIFREKQGGIK